MAGARVQPAYVEDYNTQISVVVPFTKKQAKVKPTLETHLEVSDSGYQSSQSSKHSSTSSEGKANPAPHNRPLSPPAEEEPDDTQLEDIFPPRRSHQYAYTSQTTSTPLARKLSSHLSSQLSSQASSPNPTPSVSKPNSVKSTSRSGSPAVNRGPPSVPAASSATASTAITEEENCDCPECKTNSKSSPTSHHHSALSSPWNLNYPPFNAPGGVPPSPHSSQHWPGYPSMTPARSAYSSRDYGYAYPPTPTTTDSGESETSSRRTRERLPARPLSYGGPAISASNPVTTNGSWNGYAYYGGHMQGSTPVNTPPPTYGQSAYSPPPVTPSSAAVPATPSSQSYSAMVGGGAYNPYSYSKDYYSQTQVAPTVPSTPAGYNTVSDYNSMPPPSAQSTRRSNRYSTGGLSGSYGSPLDYTERSHERYAREYAEKYGTYSDKHSDRGSDKYSDKYTDKYASDKYASDKYAADKYAADKYASDKYAERYPERYNERYYEKNSEKYLERQPDNKYYADRSYDKYSDKYYYDRYPDKYSEYHQQSHPVSRRMSQRTSQGSGAYSGLQDIVPRSTSVPPVDLGASTSAELKRRTATPQPMTSMRRRDSTSGSGSAGALARLSSSSFSRTNTSAIEDDYYGRSPPSAHQYHHQYYSSYDGHHALTARQHGTVASNYYRNSDSGFSGGIGESRGGEMMPLALSDGTCDITNNTSNWHSNMIYRREARAGN